MNRHNISAKVVAYILTRTLEELSQLTRNEIATEFNVNRNYLSKKFKRDTNMSVFGFIEFEKMIRAKILLHDRTELSVMKISKLLGVSKVNQFRKKFKRFYHITPGLYRKSIARRHIGTTHSHNKDV